jgi:predicted transcriptional regulator
MRPLESPEVQDNIIKRLANGETQTAVAHSLGVSQAAISKFASNPEIRELIRAEAVKLIGSLPVATDNIRHLIENMQGSNDPKMKNWV